MHERTKQAQRDLGRQLAEVLERTGLPQADRVQCMFALAFGEARKQGYTKQQIAEWAVRAFDAFAAAEARAGLHRLES